MTTYLYWIHYPHHTDPAQEGYIGVTRNPDGRFKAHSNSPDNKMVKGAIRKGALLTVLAEYDKENDALLEEERRRPDALIGWNLVPGGGKPPPFNPTPENRARVSKRFKGKKQTAEHVKKKAESRRGFRNTPDTIELIRQRALKRHVIRVTCLKCKRDMDYGNYCKTHGEKCGQYKGPSWNSGKTMSTKGSTLDKLQCPHCNKLVDAGNMKRWHGNNCKLLTTH